MSKALIVPDLAAGPFRLRPFTPADVGAVQEASGDPYIPLITTVPVPFSEDEGRRFIERQWSRAEQGTGYSFAIADGDTDHAVGQIGLWLKEISEGRASVGYWVVRSARGRQVAARSLQALALWACHQRHPDHPVSPARTLDDQLRQGHWALGLGSLTAELSDSG
jgi:RimJ/RimL family protein N-acetyltransferase